MSNFEKKIKSADIRLRNLFLVSGFLMYVTAIFEETVYLDFEGNEGDVWEEDVKDLDPIPLTEEWLLKCSIFHKSHNEYGNTYHILKNGFEVRYTIEHWTKTDNPKYKGRFHWVGIGEIKFFHQLQNLYSSLTNEELEVKI